METFVGNNIVRNGVQISLDDWSHFGPGQHGTMHFPGRSGLNDPPYVEVLALRCNTPVEYYAIPPDSKWEMEKDASGEITIRIWAAVMPKTPILEWVFPNPENIYDEAYKIFMRDI